MAILIKSNTPDSDKDFWATTWQAFSDAEALYGRKFQVDVAAEASTAKCLSYFVRPGDSDPVAAGVDAMLMEWPADWWCNPPFAMKPEFIAEARQGAWLMRRYYHSVLPNWNPAWMLIPLAVWAILLSVALSLPVAYGEPGVRHALPNPYVPECYAVEWHSGSYCEFMPVKKG